MDTVSNFTHLLNQQQKNANNQAYYKYFAHKYRTENNQDFARMRDVYKLAAGEVDEGMFRHIFAPHGENVGNLPVKFKHKDVISPTIKRLQGLESSRKFTAKLVAINNEAVNRKREEERNRMRMMVTNDTMNELRAMIDGQIPQDTKDRDNLINSEVEKATPERIRKYMQKTYRDQSEIIGSHILNYTKKEQDVDTKFMLGAFDAFTCGKYIFYTGIENNKSVVKRIDPRCFTYGKSVDSPFIKHFDYGTIHYYLTPAKIVEYWGTELNKATINSIYELINNSSSGASFGFSATEPINFSNTVYYAGNITSDALIYVTHTIWRGLTEKGFLTYMNEDGILVKDIVDRSYKLDKMLGDYEIEWKYVPELHEAIMIGNDIIVKAGPVANQLFDIDNIYKKDLPFKGVILNEFEGQAKGLVDYQMSYALLYDIVLYRIEEYMSKDKGKALLMNMDILGLDLNHWFNYLDKNNIGFFSFADTNQSKIGNRDINALAKEIDRSFAAKIDQYIGIAEFLENKIKTTVGLTPQFEGQIRERESNQNVDKAVSSATLALEPMFYLMNLAKNDVMQAALENQIACFIKHRPKSISYVLDDVGIVSLELDYNLLLESKYYLFMEDMAKYDKVKNVLEQLAIVKAQSNQLELSYMGRFLMLDDPDEAIEILKLGEEMFNKNQQAAEQNQAQNAMALEDKKHENAKDLINTDYDRKEVLEEIKGEFDILKATVVGSGFAEDKDINNNEVPDIVEIAKNLLDARKFEYQKIKDANDAKLKQRELDIKEIAAKKPKTTAK